MMEMRLAIILILSAVLFSCEEQAPQAAPISEKDPQKTIWSGLTTATPERNSGTKGPLDILLKELDTSSSVGKEDSNKEAKRNEEANLDTELEVDPNPFPGLRTGNAKDIVAPDFHSSNNQALENTLERPAPSPAKQESADVTFPGDAGAETPLVTSTPNVGLKLNEIKSEDAAISGEMHIEFGSRLVKDGTDIYSLNLVCGESIRIKGKILREASVVSSIVDRDKKPLEYQYYLDLSLINPTNHSREQRAAKIKGSIFRLGDGSYNADGLALEAVLPASAAPLSGVFFGKLLGRDEESGEPKGATYTREIGRKQITLNVGKIDPIKFEDFVLGGGPTKLNPETKLAGSFDYDYETGDWITSGITFDHEGSAPDKMTGSIKWNADPDREHNGKGQYEFNLRFNEDLYNAAANWASSIDLVGDEQAFFMVDTEVPTLRGEIKFQDSFKGKDINGQPLVTKSDIRYELIGSKLTKPQLLNFLKMWLVMVGPVNDL